MDVRIFTKFLNKLKKLKSGVGRQMQIWNKKTNEKTREAVRTDGESVPVLLSVYIKK